MKYFVTALVFTAVIGGLAHAVSIDFPTYSAVSVGEVKTENADDGITTVTTLEFSGSGLKPFMAMLPKVTDENGQQIQLRMLSITNAGEKNVPADASTAIYIQCEGQVPACKITIIKGVIPG